MEELKTTLQFGLAPLNIKVDIVYEDNVYSIIMDGRKTYKHPDEWGQNWTQGLIGFGKSFLSLEQITPKEAVEIKPAVAKFIVGSLFDILKHE